MLEKLEKLDSLACFRPPKVLCQIGGLFCVKRQSE
jgi:hypothetical protein